MKRLAAILLFLLALSPAAAEAAPGQLWQLPEAGPGNGGGAGEIDGLRAFAASPLSGDLYVGDVNNARVDEFTAWGEFVRAFGWKVDASNPEEKLQVCTAASGCQKGSEGAGAGQFRNFVGTAIDSAGNLYVADLGNHRVQKFDPEGHFLLMFGGEVDKTTNANLCTAASGHLCGIGTTGTANGQFANWLFDTQLVAAGPDDKIYVGDEDRIQAFDSEGVYQSQIALPKEGEVEGGAPGGKERSGTLAVDGAGNLYFNFFEPFGTEKYPYIFKHTTSGWSLFAKPTLNLGGIFTEPEIPQVLATDSEGHLYAEALGHGRDRVREYDSSGAQLIPSKAEEAEKDEENNEAHPFAWRPGYEVTALATSGGACGIPGGGLYVGYRETDSLLAAYGAGPDPDLCPPPRNPPAIAEQFATAVGSTYGILRAKVNSHFWPSTSYYLEYGTAPCSLGGCVRRPATSLDLDSKTNSPVLTAGLLLSGLQAGATYHYRFVASTCFEAKAGGEECEAGQEAVVKGVGGTPGSDGAEATFTTAEPTLPPKQDCDNQAFRTGPSQALPDCRAYELVSPPEKAGGDVVSLVNVTGFPARLDQSAASGEAITYSAYRPFSGSPSANTSSQYLASREAGVGWSTEAISPPFGRSLFAAGANVDREYRLFSPDLCQSWLRLDYEQEPVLDPAAVDGFPNLFRRDNCEPGAGSYEALSTLAPPHQEAQYYIYLELQGVSADGQTAVYVANDNLTPEAPAINANSNQSLQLYARAPDGATRFVCYLPDGSLSSAPCAAGAGGGDPRKARLTGALSADGSKVFFTTNGSLYLRTNPTQPQSAVSGGHCTEEEAACTTLIGAGADFWAASPEGSRALFTTSGGALREYDTEAGIATIAGSGVLGVLGQSSDLSRVYFASTAKLAPQATAAEPNLYFHETGEPTRFIAVLSKDDVDAKGGGIEAVAISPEPIKRAARVSGDGLFAAFVSRAPLGGYDNTDAESSEAAAEVFVYQAQANGGEGQLSCVSCDPSGTRPSGASLKMRPWEGIRVAAWISTSESSLYSSNALSKDGSRLFFNSEVPLVARDTNGRRDVYEWEAADSKAACEELGAERYLPATGGCLSLISSGEDVLDSEFIDADPTATDVFFATGASLVPQDPDLIDIYDARVKGGLPVPPGLPAACEGEACQSPPAPPVDASPASEVFRGAGNVVEPALAKCRKGLVLRHGKCLKARHSQRHAKKNRRHQGGATR